MTHHYWTDVVLDQIGKMATDNQGHVLVFFKGEDNGAVMRLVKLEPIIRDIDLRLRAIEKEQGIAANSSLLEHLQGLSVRFDHHSNITHGAEDKE